MAGKNGKNNRRNASTAALRQDSAKRREKKKRKSQVSVGGFILRFAVLIAVFVITYVIMVNSSFKVEDFKIEGNSVVSDEDIISLSGISVGDSLFRCDVNAAEDQIALHVMIDDVTVRVRPFHKILIEVTEKNAVAGFMDEDRYYYIDANMVVVGETETVDTNLPLFSGFTVPTFVSIGLEMNDRNLAADILIAEEAVKYFKKYPLEICASSQSVNTMYLDGVEIRLGTTGQLSAKMEALKSLVTQMSEQKLKSLEYIDISIPDEPVVKERPLGNPTPTEDEAAAEENTTESDTTADEATPADTTDTSEAE